MANYNKWLTEIRLRPSRLLLAVLSVAHIAALSIVLLMPLPLWLMAVLATLVVISMVHATVFQAMLQGRNAVIVLKTTQTGLEVATRLGVWNRVDILASTFVSPWLVVLHLRQEGRRRPMYVMLLPDMLSSDEFRRLRVWLRWADVLAHGKRQDAVL